MDVLATRAVGSLMATRDGRRVLAVLVVAGLLVLGGFWVWEHHLRPRHPVGPTVRIATWNLRQFSEGRSNIDLRAIADVIRSNQFDVVAVQEVKRDAAMVDRLLNVLGSPWRATSFSDVTGNHERFVFLYHGDHVQELGTPHFIATADAVIFDRVPYQQTFRAGNFDFTLVTCHLYYGDGQTGSERRRREAEALARFARQLAERSDEKDVIVLGDFNEMRGAAANLPVFKASDLEPLNREPTNLSSKQVYDSLLINPSHTREWNGHASAVRFDETTFRGDDRAAARHVSDHRPAFADFVTNLPDDDGPRLATGQVTAIER